MKVSEFLTEARAELDAGWVQGTWQNGGGDVCHEGACDRVAMRHLDQIPVAAAARAAIDAKAMEIYNEASGRIVNDMEGRTKQDMLDLYDKTIIGLEERGQ
ncbi:hypothetical protein A5717_26085 [Mycolicibacterium porcinum]|uniref:DUF6197 family protein n=1 Tax=Mycolicibacterium porcinum TaxID=39693 RepID=UPI00080B4DF8|nr:hypothetical protein A5717_26085 [Mycolicibacterium porcinum]